jgi:ribonuclease HI
MIETTMLVAWRAWYARNEVIHEKPIPPLEGSKRFLCNYLNLIQNIKTLTTEEMVKGEKPELQASSSSHVNTKEQPPDLAWCRPPPGYTKLSIDGSFHAGDGAAGAGMVLRDEHGNAIFTACRFMEHCSGPLEAELQACLEGVMLALQHCQLPVIVETDCSQLVAAAKGNTIDRSLLVHLISELRILSSHERVSDVVKVERSQIWVSHNLANLARVNHQTVFWLGSGPDDILQILENDRLVTLAE